MSIFSRIAERRITEAVQRGDFDNLEGRGRPLAFEDEAWIPEDMRMAYKILRNAGCLPPEMELHKEAIGLRQLISTLDDDEQRLKAIRELNFKLMKLSELRGRPVYLDEFPAYEAKILDRMFDR